MRIAARTVWGAEPEEMSLLHALFYMRSAGGLDPLLDVEGGAQESRIVGGSQLLAERLAAELGSSLLRDSPVAAIRAEGPGLAVEAGRPPSGPAGRSSRCRCRCAARSSSSRGCPMRTARSVTAPRFGRLIKCVAVYDEPFWRSAGLSGEALSDRGPATLTFDNSPPGGRPGVLLGFVGGSDARRHAELGEDDRRAPRAGVLRAPVRHRGRWSPGSTSSRTGEPSAGAAAGPPS